MPLGCDAFDHSFCRVYVGSAWRYRNRGGLDGAYGLHVRSTYVHGADAELQCFHAVDEGFQPRPCVNWASGLGPAIISSQGNNVSVYMVVTSKRYMAPVGSDTG